jgi:hypothetical protein
LDGAAVEWVSGELLRECVPPGRDDAPISGVALLRQPPRRADAGGASPYDDDVEVDLYVAVGEAG